MITQKLLKEFLHYDPMTGVFTRLKRTCSRNKVGDIAGTIDSNGYVVIRIFGALRYAHRLAWFYMKGVWPRPEIDHRDTVRDNNRWKNLREATRAINAQNKRKAQNNSKTGLLGVSPHGVGFDAYISLNKKRYYLGYYSTSEQAHAARLKAERKLRPEYIMVPVT